MTLVILGKTSSKGISNKCHTCPIRGQVTWRVGTCGKDAMCPREGMDTPKEVRLEEVRRDRVGSTQG